MKGSRGFAEIVMVIGITYASYVVFKWLDSHLARGDGQPDLTLFDYVDHRHDDRKKQRAHARLLGTTLRAGADPDTLNDKRETPLHVAIAQPEPSYRLMKILLKFGADPDYPNAMGATSLHLAARHGSGAMMTALLKAGGNPLILTRGQTETPYALAVRLGNDGAVGAIERSRKFKRDKKKVKRRGP